MKYDSSKVLATYLKRWLDAHETNARQLAMRAHIGQATINRILKADGSIRLDILDRLASATNIEPSELISIRPGVSEIERRIGALPNERLRQFAMVTLALLERTAHEPSTRALAEPTLENFQDVTSILLRLVTSEPNLRDDTARQSKEAGRKHTAK